MHLLRDLPAKLSRHTALMVTLAALLGAIRPATFGWVQGESQVALLGLIMLAMGVTLAPKDVRELARRPWIVAAGTLAQFTVMPCAAWALAKALGLPPALTAGLLLVGTCPGGVSSNLMSWLCKGDVAYSVGMTTLSTLLAPLATPLLTLLLAGVTVQVDPWPMFRSILTVTLAPVLLGFLLNTFLGTTAFCRHLCAAMPAVAVLALGCIVGGVASQQSGAILASGPLIFAAVLLHNASGYLLGYASATALRLTPPQRRTLSIEVGMQNAGLATVLATRHFPQMPEAAMLCAMACIWHSVSGAVLANLFLSLQRAPKPDSTP